MKAAICYYSWRIGAQFRTILPIYPYKSLMATTG